MTNLEKKVFQSLLKIGFVVDEGSEYSWVSQYKIEKYRIDFAWPFIKLAIEVDGDFWHGSGLLSAAQFDRKIKDKKKQEDIRKLGWTTIRVKERFLQNKNFDEILNNSILKIIEISGT